MLYHISFDTENIIHKFEPRIPEEILESENNKIGRICVSDSIENCLSAIPGRDEILDEFEIKQVSENLPEFIIYEFDENQISNKNLLNSNIIKKYVLDSEITNEIWIVNQNAYPLKISLAKLKNYESDYIDRKLKITKVEYEIIEIFK